MTSRTLFFYIGTDFKMLRSRTPILREKVFCIAYASFTSFMPCKSSFFCPYRVTAARRFLMRSAACLRVIRFRQSGQYLTLFDFDTKMCRTRYNAFCPRF